MPIKSLDISAIGEMMDTVTGTVQKILLECERLQNEYTFDKIDKIPDKGFVNVMDDIESVQGDISLWVMDLTNISWMLLNLKRNTEGSRTMVESFRRNIDEIRTEIKAMQASLRMHFYHLKDKIEYLKYRMEIKL